jgi:hypothetical protein
MPGCIKDINYAQETIQHNSCTTSKATHLDAVWSLFDIFLELRKVVLGFCRQLEPLAPQNSRKAQPNPTHSLHVPFYSWVRLF